MADVITRFKLETTQYDSKLRDASKGLAEYTRQATLAGNEFGKFTQKNVEAAHALGSISPSATNAKDKVKELTAAFNDTARAYNALTKEQQQSDFGKAMAGSLQQLQQRITDAKSDLNSTGGVLDVLKDKFTVNIDAVKLFNVGMSASSAALDVAKDAFFNNEEQLDEWGRVVESSHSLYQGFLNALNTGDISGYLNNINKIVQAARDAYDALDALGTYNAFNQINVEKTRTGMTESIADYRGGTGSKDAVKAAGEAYKKELQDRKRLENEAYLAAVKRMASERGINAKDLQDALSGTYGHYQDLKNVQPTGVRQTVVGSGMFARTGTETFAQNRQEKLGEALRHLNDTELQSLQALGAQAQRTGNEIAQVDKQLTRVLNGKQPGETTGGGGGRSSGGGGSKGIDIGDFNKQLGKSMIDTDALKAENVPSDAWNTMREAIAGCKEEMADFSAETANWTQDFDPYKQKMDEVTKAAKQQQMAFNMGAEAAANLGAAFASMEDPAAKAAGTVISAIANIALGFAQASVQASSMGPWGWVAFLAAGAAAMATTISTVHSLTGYANGGVVKGSSYSGDNIPALVDGSELVGLNAGEIVLTAAQAGNVAQNLQGSNRNVRVTGHIAGHDLVLAVDRTLSIEGKGHLVSFKG